MCVKMNADIVEIIAARNFEAVWEICLIKCDFTAEIQPQKADSGTEPLSVGVVWLRKQRKLYLSHLLCSQKIVLQYPCIRKTSTKLCFCKKHIELYLIGRHLGRNTKHELSTTD